MKNISKKTLWIIVLAAVIVIGASISASALLKKNPKEQYFSAELNSFQFMKEVVENRYSDELDWVEATKEKPSESTFEVSAEYNDPSGYDMTGMSDIINNATITLKSGYNPEKQEMSLEAGANIAELSIEGIQFYLTSDKAMFTLPFLKEFVQVNETDLGDLLQQADPYTFSGEEEIEFDNFFKQSTLSEDQLKHLQDTYVKMIYDELPEDAFAAGDETVDVNGEKVDASKVTLSLSENQVKGLLKKVLSTMENDDQLKEIIKDQASLNPVTLNNGEITAFLEDFEEGIKESKEDLEDLKLPNGLTSILWMKDDLIVKRAFSVDLGYKEEEPVQLSLTADQLLTKEAQNFDYTLGFKDEWTDDTFHITGDLSWKDNKADDEITLTNTGSGLEFNYTSTEELAGGTRDFDRSFSMNDPASMEAYNLIWDGQSSYDKDQMNAEHHLALEGEGISQDIFQLNVSSDAKLVKSLDIDTGSENVVDIGKMSPEEMESYYYEDVMPQLQNWMMEYYGSFYNSNMGF
ncbi:DUF6583 family protein [Virgibacillus senegalensis]|uniref:DUF6583 family protein n=1 Tax=Virgibacillus senegalensis TaxID=1499679 RepID=UPI00069E28F9|nr:DUF6583 family protein [Virgibacillus senegalensis]